MILASVLALATLSAPASPLLAAPAAAAHPAPVCQGAPGRPALCRPAVAAAAPVAERADAAAGRVAVAACHPDPGKNRGCFRRTAIGEAALAQNAVVREDAR